MFSKKLKTIFFYFILILKIFKNTFTSLNNNLANFKTKTDIIAVSKTTLHKSKITKNIELEGYEFICKNFDNSSGSVGIYAKMRLVST